MGIRKRIDDDARYYLPSLVTDAASDRADEIAVGSNGGSKGYVVDSGVQDTPMYLTVANRNLTEVPQGFAFLLGSFSGVWMGGGAVKIRLVDADNRMLFKDFLTDDPLDEYDYAVELALMDNSGHIAAKGLAVDSSGYDSELGKYRHSFKVDASEIIFGSDSAETPLTDLSKVSVYLRGYFYKGLEHIEYIGGGIEFGGGGGSASFYLRGYAGAEWHIYNIDFGAIDVTGGEFPSSVEYMPESERITATVLSYTNATTILRSQLLSVWHMGDESVVDMIPVSQKSTVQGNLEFSMRSIRMKSSKARNFKFKIFVSDSHSWSVTEKPGWVTVSDSSGNGSATLTIGFSANDTSEARGGMIVFRDTTAGQNYEIPCVQWGIERFYAVEDIVPGQAKTIKAYAASIAANAFDMEVMYYNSPTFVLYLRQIGFNITDFAAASEGIGTLNMVSGPCAGRSFSIRTCEYDATDDRWRLTLDRLEDSSVGMVFPNISFPINAGDRFVLTDILMPEVYIFAAGKRLLAKARAYYDRNSKLRYLYDLEIDSKWMKNEGAYLRPGMYMKLADADLVGADAEHVLIDTVTVTHSESNIPVFKVTLREKLYLPE